MWKLTGIEEVIVFHTPDSEVMKVEDRIRQTLKIYPNIAVYLYHNFQVRGFYPVSLYLDCKERESVDNVHHIT